MALTKGQNEWEGSSSSDMYPTFLLRTRTQHSLIFPPQYFHIQVHPSSDPSALTILSFTSLLSYTQNQIPHALFCPYHTKTDNLSYLQPKLVSLFINCMEVERNNICIYILSLVSFIHHICVIYPCCM